MIDIKLEKGDCFVVRTDGLISAPIRWIEKAQDLDCEATYNHAGIVVNPNGQTFESLERIDHYSIADYVGSQILVFRHVEMTNELFEQGWNSIKKYEGNIYPAWRFVLFLLRVAKWLHFTYPVCSELVWMFECDCGLRKRWAGYTPDDIADEVHISKYYQIKYEGTW